MTAPADVLARLEELRSLARIVHRLDRYDGPDRGFVGAVRDELVEALAGRGVGRVDVVPRGDRPLAERAVAWGWGFLPVQVAVGRGEESSGEDVVGSG
ncbi:hypothetical protein Lfu02_45500 [Longispora fulva]|uniref:Uncharacterized protein n=1 Tax=Longispora fulva TaxID=619741 RepID=A0A8J7KH02_9ACTN|nr:hypothetical protein [Longispora fulva]MBG6137925.1 hypothetical protein [Longispora fulva]GIG60178.1 hypothetical protein Lfu02_45500 [Longispora fulva]